MESMGLGTTASTVQNLAKNFHYSQFQLSEIAAKGICYQYDVNKLELYPYIFYNLLIV